MVGVYTRSLAKLYKVQLFCGQNEYFSLCTGLISWTISEIIPQLSIHSNRSSSSVPFLFFFNEIHIWAQKYSASQPMNEQTNNLTLSEDNHWRKDISGAHDYICHAIIARFEFFSLSFQWNLNSEKETNGAWIIIYVKILPFQWEFMSVRKCKWMQMLSHQLGRLLSLEKWEWTWNRGRQKAARVSVSNAKRKEKNVSTDKDRTVTRNLHVIKTLHKWLKESISIWMRCFK